MPQWLSSVKFSRKSGALVMRKSGVQSKSLFSEKVFANPKRKFAI